MDVLWLALAIGWLELLVCERPKCALLQIEAEQREREKVWVVPKSVLNMLRSAGSGRFEEVLRDAAFLIPFEDRMVCCFCLDSPALSTVFAQ